MKPLVFFCAIFLTYSLQAQESHRSFSQNDQQRLGLYTGKNWQQWIDTTWGPGISTAGKLDVFDSYWNLVDQTWGGFPNLVVNWDSLRNVYRPMVEAGISRGRFYGILSRLARALNEWHVAMIDFGIDSALGVYWNDAEYPNYQSYNYQPGIPIFNTSPFWFRTNFGAGVTLLDDSSSLVYNVMPNHPLNLQPGDLILGYDGIPWKDLIKELFDAELPILSGGALLGSNRYVESHVAMMSVGMNWGLFDTIDVFKYSTQTIVHFPTSLLKSISQPYHIATEQLPINGVPFPNISAGKMVSWGVVEGTTIGYIYVLDWNGYPEGETGVLFGQAVDELLHTHKVTGLIIDSRTNWGGWLGNAHRGFKQLFNFDPTSNFSRAIRINDDHNAFTLVPPWPQAFFAPGTYIFDRPIAILTGPNCGSAGDWCAYLLRFHPMARFFGKRTNGAFTAGGWNNAIYYNSYLHTINNGTIYSHFNDEGYLMHKSFPIDEEIWLTQAGVANGEDDVVKRAVDWITSTAYAYDPTGTFFAGPDGDTDMVLLRVKVRNPINDTLTIVGILKTLEGVRLDSAYFFNDGLHADGAAGDSVWGCFLPRPAGNPALTYAIRVRNNNLGTVREVSYKIPITTGVGGDAQTSPTEFGLSQNYPNPFNPTTVISYQLTVLSRVSLRVYDVLGREVATLVSGEQPAGVYRAEWNASVASGVSAKGGYASGVYFYRLEAIGNDGRAFVETKKLLLLK